MSMRFFCDFDGTLIDIKPRHYRVYASNMQKIGATPLDANTYWKLKRNNMKWPTILTQSGLNLNETDIIYQKFMDGFIQDIESPKELTKDMLFTGAKKALEELNEIGTVYLISLRRSDTGLQEQVKRLGVNKYFQEILSGHTEGIDTHTVKTVFVKERLGSDINMMIGDTEADINAAKSLRIKSAAVFSGIRSEEFLRSLQPDYLINDITKLPKVIRSLSTG